MTGPRRRTPAELADAAYQALRELNHATFPGQCSLTGHHELYLVVDSLAELLHAAPQALRQAADWAAREHQAGRARVDDDCPASPASTIGAIVTALDDAAVRTAGAARRVDAAQQVAAHVIIEQPPRLDM